MSFNLNEVNDFLGGAVDVLMEGSKKMNVATVPLVKARAYAESVFRKAGKDLDAVLPDFNKNYLMLQRKTKAALDVPRIQMPVIEPVDMKDFHGRLKKGRLDLFQPYAKGKLKLAGSSWNKMDDKEGQEWVELGVKDGNKTDDVIKASWGSVAGKDMLPTQSQIWLEKLIVNIDKFGKPGPGSPILKTTIIVSKEGYILDGHHRFGQVMLADPGLKIRALKVPLSIGFLLKVGRSYGGARGHTPKA